MEFLGVGYQELLLILVLLLVVVGPERLPGVAYQIGRAVRTMQQYARAVRNEFSDEIAYIEEQYKVVKGEVDSARQELRTQQQALESELRAQGAEIDAGLRDAQAALQLPTDTTPAARPSLNGHAPAAEAAPGTPAEPSKGAPLVF